MFPWIFSQFFFNTGAAFERCSIKVVVSQNDVIKYSSSAPGVKSRKALHSNLLKIALHHRYFTNNVTTSSEQRYWKIHLNGYFWGQSFSENIPEWLLLKGNCDNIFILKVLMATHILHLLLWRHVKEERILF